MACGTMHQNFIMSLSLTLTNKSNTEYGTTKWTPKRGRQKPKDF